jgi:hypothetical protein
MMMMMIMTTLRNINKNGVMNMITAPASRTAIAMFLGLTELTG